MILDGTVLPIDRIAADQPYCSGKEKYHGMNVQVLAGPGRRIWALDALPGATHDLTAARIHGLGLGSESPTVDASDHCGVGRLVGTLTRRLCPGGNGGAAEGEDLLPAPRRSGSAARGCRGTRCPPRRPRGPRRPRS